MIPERLRGSSIKFIEAFKDLDIELNCDCGRDLMSDLYEGGILLNRGTNRVEITCECSEEISTTLADLLKNKGQSKKPILQIVDSFRL